MNNSILEDLKNIFRSKNYLYQVIFINAAIFILLNIIIAATPSQFSGNIIKYISLPAELTDSVLLFWTYFTYMFVHMGLNHLFFNMLLLYMIGKIFSDLYGASKFIKTYIISGVLGGILYVISSNLLPSISTDSYLIGASAGVMGIIVAIGFLQPNYMVQIFTYRVSLKYVVLTAFILSSVLYIDKNTGGKVAHFGGAIYGYIYAYFLPKGLDTNNLITNLFSGITRVFKSKPKIKVVHKNKEHQKKSNSAQDQVLVDKILDKISKSGYDSLTKKEKEFLFNFGK